MPGYQGFLGYGDPVGRALDAGEKGLAIGTAIRRGPELEQQQRQTFEAQQQAQERAASLQEYQLMDKQREESAQQSNRDLTYRINDLTAKYGKGGPKDLSVNNNQIDPDDRDAFASSLVGSGVPFHIGTPQFKSDVGTVFGTIQGQGVPLRSPQFAQAANRLYAPSLNHGAMQSDNIAQQNIAQIVPGPGGTMHIDLSNTTNDGKAYNAPLTLGRTSDDHDPVKPVSAEAAVQHTVGLAALDQHISENPVLQQVMSQIQAMPQDQQFAYMMRLGKSRLASAQGQLVPSEGQIATGPDGKPLISANGYFVTGTDGKPQFVETKQTGQENVYDTAKRSVADGVYPDLQTAIRAFNNKGNPSFVVGGAPKYQPFQDKDGALWNFNPSTGQYSKAGAPEGGGPSGLTKVGGAGGGTAMTPDAIKVAASSLRSTGQLPQGMSRDKASVAAVQNEAASQAMSEGKTAEAEAMLRASNKSKQGAMADMQKRNAALEASARTAENNFKLIEDQAKKVDRTGSPLINKLKQAFQTSVVQDPELAKLKNMVSETATEYAKVVTGQTTGAGVSDAANAQTQKLISVSDNPAAFAAELSGMRQMIASKRQGYGSELQALTDSLNPAGGQRAPTGKTHDDPIPASDKAAYDSLTSGTYYVDPQGTIGLKK